MCQSTEPEAEENGTPAGRVMHAKWLVAEATRLTETISSRLASGTHVGDEEWESLVELFNETDEQPELVPPVAPARGLRPLIMKVTPGQGDGKRSVTRVKLSSLIRQAFGMSRAVRT